MDEETKIIIALADSAVDVAKFKGSDAMNTMDKMLSNLAEAYKNQLANVTVDELVRIQACLKQTLAIQGVIRGTQQLPSI
ncbi:hypothetical protein [Polynucleobacter sp. UK-Kesae-W10]|uniref:hypothetical protein n=1 Tax=Polynucleobacter sp. UK-Kesae-W10 TaxID=1819738 RepID=UPI001C0C01AC|nr:hypothetical protein [Polynucleobacter sp. UK-Kesae-W10]MBU3577573.1 hypothetical protein [Polynucleobacter sp. UK-Kesae-W10]